MIPLDDVQGFILRSYGMNCSAFFLLRVGNPAAARKTLGALGVTTLVLAPGCTQADIEERLTAWLTDGPIHGLYWLAALDPEPPIDQLDLAGWRLALDGRVKNLHGVVRRLDAAGHLGPHGTFLVSGTRLGGYHGYDEAGALAPLGGAVTGFTKAYRRERPELLAKAVDFPATTQTGAVAEALIEETGLDPGAIEVGRGDHTHCLEGFTVIVGFGEDRHPGRLAEDIIELH